MRASQVGRSEDLNVVNVPSTSGLGVKFHQTGPSKRQFKETEDEDKIYELSNKHFAEQSKRKIRWTANLYSEWRLKRVMESGCPTQIVHANLDHYSQIVKVELAYSLSRFLREVKRLDGKEYPPNTLRELIVMIQMFLHERGMFWKLLDDSEFRLMRNVLDNTMKERTAQGLGVRQSSSIISLSHEDMMFSSGSLGQSSPDQLLRTVIYMMGLHLALWGGVEHNRLRRPGFGCQVVLEIYENKEPLVYREDALQKTNQGGLNAKNSHKVVYVYEASNAMRCPVKIFKKYVGLLLQSKSCGKLYLRPRQKYSPSVWYCDQPYGKNKIANTVKEICNKAGIEGHFTNHSLRATSTSRMYQCNVPEQVIKEVTGHRSDCVRVYKKMSDQLREHASKTIVGEENLEPVVKKRKVEQSESLDLSDEQKDRLKSSLSVCQIIKNVVKTRMEMRKKCKVGSENQRIGKENCEEKQC